MAGLRFVSMTPEKVVIMTSPGLNGTVTRLQDKAY